MPFPLAIITGNRLDDLALCLMTPEAKQPADSLDEHPNYKHDGKQEE